MAPVASAAEVKSVRIRRGEELVELCGDAGVDCDASDGDLAAAGGVGLNDPAAAEDDAPGREVRALDAATDLVAGFVDNILHQFHQELSRHH